MTRIGFYGNNVSLLKFQAVDIVIISFTGVLELNFHKVCAPCVSGNVCKPVIGVELFVLSAYTASAKSSVTSVTYLEIHIFIIHTLNLSVEEKKMMSGPLYYFLIINTIIFSAKSKKTILALAFWPMSRYALLSSSQMSMMLASLTKRAKFLAKFSSSCVM